MVPPFKVWTSALLVVAVFVCGLAVTPSALAQRLPKPAGRDENKPSGSRRIGRHKPQPAPPPAASKNPASVESGNFFALGERFRKQNKWKAAEAAYKEAVTVWSANVDARLALGFLYL